ncbi:TPA: phage major capsid protein [Vibrio cholerae]|nr:phage major capsid protein [Vibrio cholerae]
MYLKIKSFEAVEEEQGIFEAYANVKYHKDKANDVTVDGAFSASIAECKASGRMPKMLLQHDYKQVVGKWLEMDEDPKGLKVKGKLCLDTTAGRDTYALLKMGALDALSIGYVTKKETYDPQTNTNFLAELDIKEISIVTFPCNDESLIESVKHDPIIEGTKSMELATKLNAQTVEIENLKSTIADLTDAFAGLSAANDPIVEVKDTTETLKTKFFDLAKTGEGYHTELVKDGKIKSDAFNTADNASAGAGVLTQVNRQIVEHIVEDYAITKLFGRDTAGSVNYERRVMTGGAGARWEGENVEGVNGAHTATPRLATIKMTHGKAIAKPIITAEALQDPFFNAETFVMGATRKALARTVAEGVVNGNGEAQPRGFMTYFDAVEGVKAVEERKVDHYPVLVKPAADLADDQKLLDALQALQYELKAGYVSGAKYVMSRKMFQRVAGIKDGLGRPMLMTSLEAGVSGRIFGFDIVVDPLLNEDKPVVFGRIADAFKVIEIPSALQFTRNPYKIDQCVEFYIATRIGTMVNDNEAVVALLVETARKAK